jgi:hypothetical protein
MKYKVSEETRKKLSISHKGKMPKNISILHTQEIREKIRKTMTGKKHTNKSRLKMSMSKKGKIPKNLEWLHEQNRSNPIIREKTKKALTGIKRLPISKEHIDAIIKANTGRKMPYEERVRRSNKYKGKNNPSWKGGITKKNLQIRGSFESKIWRESVFIRDNWTCQKCLERGIKLNTHHINNFAEWPELRFAIDNGITLCKECHLKFHKLYGRTKNNKEQIKLFLKNY